MFFVFFSTMTKSCSKKKKSLPVTIFEGMIPNYLHRLAEANSNVK